MRRRVKFCNNRTNGFEDITFFDFQYGDRRHIGFFFKQS